MLVARRHLSRHVESRMCLRPPESLKWLSRRNPHFRTDFEAFLSALDAKTHPVIPYTGGARKARMKVAGRAKRDGYRVIHQIGSPFPHML